MTTKETNFANEYIFLYFNGNEVLPARNAERAAIKAGYELPGDIRKRDAFCKNLLNESGIKEYITEQITAIKEKLSTEQRRNLWAVIVAMEVGEPSTEFSGFLPLKVC